MVLFRSRFLLQSLVLGWWWPTEMKMTQLDTGVIADSNEWNDNAIPYDDTPPMPDPSEYALMARYVVHQANWTAVAYISHDPKTKGRALADAFAVSDGPMSDGTGIPYIYVSRLQAAVSDLLDNDGKASFVMSLAETDICQSKGWDPQDPRCAHVTLVGTVGRVSNTSAEYKDALEGVFVRHPSFRTLPSNHQFFLAKFTITGITLQDNFGGPADVPVTDYFKVKNTKLGLISKYYALKLAAYLEGRTLDSN